MIDSHTQKMLYIIRYLASSHYDDILAICDDYEAQMLEPDISDIVLCTKRPSES